MDRVIVKTWLPTRAPKWHDAAICSSQFGTLTGRQREMPAGCIVTMMGLDPGVIDVRRLEQRRQGD